MKKITFIICIIAMSCCIRQNVSAQITLEHTYPNAYMQLYMINLEIEGMKYARRINADSTVMLYNLDHSVFKVMPYENAPGLGGLVFYISEHLFNTDDAIEYMVLAMSSNNPPGYYITTIINEAGTVLFTFDSLAPSDLVLNEFQTSIYNTADGTKMILSHGYNGGLANVYSLPGTLSNVIRPTGNSTLETEQWGMNAFPNPSNQNVTIEYKLPQGENTGEIVFYDMRGIEIKRVTVDNTFNTLLVNNTGLTSGTYFYQLVTSSGASGASKMIVIQ